MDRSKAKLRTRDSLKFALVAGILCAVAGIAPSAAQVPESGRTDALRGPVDLGLTDPALVGAIDIHLHLDPDSPGPGGTIRILDPFDAVTIAKSRGMRGFVYKSHLDTAGAVGAFLVRKRLSPTFEIFGRMPMNYPVGGINPAALYQFSQLRGGWGRIFEMPTRDSITATTGPGAMEPATLARTRPWMLQMPPGTPPFIAVSRNGELLPEVKHIIGEMAKARTIDTNAPMVLATGHATNEEHLLLVREGRRVGLNVVLTHPGDIPQLPEAARLGAFIELIANGVYRSEATKKTAADFIRKIGAEHIIVATDCGQPTNVYPSDCLALAAQALRAHGITQRELDLMYKVNPAKLLSLPLPDPSLVAAR
jgi:hypothetical protein